MSKINRNYFLIGLFPLLLSLCVKASDAPIGLSFQHNDWELACDNTGTCRAAGYQSDDEALTVSVLLTRQAGANTPVTGQIQIGFIGIAEIENFPPLTKATLFINDKNIGESHFSENNFTADLSVVQVTALLASLSRNSKIEWVSGDYHWHLSDKGAAAVLLKMDEYQKRLNTKNALIKKGLNDDSQVLLPSSIPVIYKPEIDSQKKDIKQFSTKWSETLRESLRKSLNANESSDCEELFLDEENAWDPNIYQLPNNKLLVSHSCFKAAYNNPMGFWVVSNMPPFNPVVVTLSGSDYTEGDIGGSFKGRGIGDCWSSNSWTWDGKKFIHSGSSTSGMCKLIIAGGAWNLPTLVTDVRVKQVQPK